MFTSCAPSRFVLEDGDILLQKQKIKGNQSFSANTLDNQFVQKPNRRIPLINFHPYLWIYTLGDKVYNEEKIKDKMEKKLEAITVRDSTNLREMNRKTSRYQKIKEKYEQKIEEGNLFMRIGEEKVLFDTTLASQSASRLSQFYYLNGYFNNNVGYNVKKKKRRAIITYVIDEKGPYIIDSMQLVSTDTTIKSLILQNEDSYLQKGDAYQQQNLSRERERISNLLKNNGFFGFNPQYVNFMVDTTFGDHQVAIRTIINKPYDGNDHQRYRVDSIIFITDADIQLRGVEREYESYGNVTFGYFDNQYKKKFLTQRIFVEKDAWYSREATLNTQQQLANMDIFKFININYDTTGGQLVANIFASPLQKYQTTNEVGVTVSQGFPGPFYNLSFKNRNLFRGLEILQLNGRAGIEGVASASDPGEVYQSSEIRANLSVTFPQFVLPINEEIKRRLGQINPKTNFQAGYSFTNRPEYNRTTTNITWGYNWQNRKQTQYSLSLFDISFINSSFKQDLFRERLEASGNLINAFNPSFVSKNTGAITYNFNSYGQYDKASAYLRIAATNGGSLLNFTGTDFLSERGLEYFKYLKLSFDFRRFLPLVYDNIFAYRIRAGVAVPYGTNGILPYEEYFFAGGSNGIRAWQPRRLGPGNYEGSRSTDVNRIEQPGEIVLESSFELRRKLVGFLDGAYFIDVGNVWTLQEDVSRPGSGFDITEFYRQLAVGTGLGLRIDFTFLILRFDFAAKVIDPSRGRGDQFVLDELSFENGNYYSPLVNIGIGYPF